MTLKKWIFIFTFLLIIFLFYKFNLNNYFTLEYIKSNQQDFFNYKNTHPIKTALIYFMIYIIITSLSLPGAAILTILGGAIFGLLWGVILVSFASSLGASFAFLASRYLFKETVQHKFSTRLNIINEHIKKEGAFYLFSIRLVPLFPFFIVNLIMGITSIRLFTYYWVSQLGMLPATIIYVNAGMQLAKIDSLGGILSPMLIFSFVLLGLFPLITKKLYQFYNKYN